MKIGEAFTIKETSIKNTKEDQNKLEKFVGVLDDLLINEKNS